LAASTSEKRKAPFLPPLKPTPFPDKTKQALIIEVIGEPDIGKTHFALTAPKAALADTELKAWVVMPKFDNKNWFPIKKFDDIRRFVMTCVNDPSIQSLIIDSSSDLRELAEDEWSEEHGGKRPVATNPQTGRITTVLYGQVHVRKGSARTYSTLDRHHRRHNKRGQRERLTVSCWPPPIFFLGCKRLQTFTTFPLKGR